MIFFSIGLPSRFAVWCEVILTHLVQDCSGAVEHCSVTSLEDLATAVIRTPASHLVVACRQPVVRLQTAIAQANRPVLVVLGDPRDALRELVEDGTYDLRDATRAVAGSCAAVLTLRNAPGALVLSGAEAADPVAAATTIARHFELGVSVDAIPAIIDALAETGLAAYRDDDGGAWWDALGEREQTIVNGALYPYWRHFTTGAALEPIVWERELFFLNEEPPAAALVPANRPLDVTGRARVLLFGPGINLPPGNWSASVALAFSAETAGMSFIVEVYVGTQLSFSRVEPFGGQVLEANLYFTIEDTLDERVQIRVLSERAGFDGRLAIGNVTLTLLSEVHSKAQEYLTQVLERGPGA
jgi:hypothetical protein